MNAADQFDAPKHTPGPWEAIGNLVRSPMVHPQGTDRPRGIMLAECADGYGVKANSAEAAANARLFAAAPDLLAELVMAGQVISVFLNELSTEQKRNCAAKIDALSIHGEGMARANERDAVLKKATGAPT